MVNWHCTQNQSENKQQQRTHKPTNKDQDGNDDEQAK